MRSVLRASIVVIVLLASLALSGCGGDDNSFGGSQSGHSIFLFFKPVGPTTVATGMPAMGYSWLERVNILLDGKGNSQCDTKIPFTRQKSAELQTGYNSVKYAGGDTNGLVEGPYEAEMYYEGVVDGKTVTTVKWHFTGILSGMFDAESTFSGTIKGSWSQTQTFSFPTLPSLVQSGSVTWDIVGGLQ